MKLSLAILATSSMHSHYIQPVYGDVCVCVCVCVYIANALITCKNQTLCFSSNLEYSFAHLLVHLMNSGDTLLQQASGQAVSKQTAG